MKKNFKLGILPQTFWKKLATSFDAWGKAAKHASNKMLGQDGPHLGHWIALTDGGRAATHRGVCMGRPNVLSLTLNMVAKL